MTSALCYNMTTIYQGDTSVAADLTQMTPYWLNAELLLDILNIMKPTVKQQLPMKRSGFPYEIHILYQACVEMSQLPPKYVGNWINKSCHKSKISFQKYNSKKFSNGKERRYFPDQPALSRAIKDLKDTTSVEDFWNLVLLAHLLTLKKMKIFGSSISLLADYTNTPCKKNKGDPYCFGTKEGKTMHKTLTFSIISNGLHQVLASFKIKKRQSKPPLFEKILDILQTYGFVIKYGLLDREFYTKEILSLMRENKITVIMPGRNSKQTKAKIENYLLDKGKRYARGFIKLRYKKKIGFIKLNFDLLLGAKRKYTLNQIKKDFKNGAITLEEATKRIFPLIVSFGNNIGVTQLRGNENYIRYLYRTRWEIEIAFREMNRLGFTTHIQNRDTRLNIMGAKSLLYNMWQVQRHLINKEKPTSNPLELNEFLGKTPTRRYIPYSSI